MLASLSSWLTPSSLFLLLNIVIGTIYLISRIPSSGRSHHHHQSGSHFHQPDPHYHQPGSDYGTPSPLARAPSLLERVKSIDFNFHNFVYHHHEASEQQQYIPPPPPNERAPAHSVLERVKSIDFFHKFAFPSYEAPYHPPEQAYHDHTPPPQERPPSMLERVKSIEIFHKFSHLNQTDHRYPHPSAQEYSSPPPLERAPSLLDRVKSINFSLNKFAPSSYTESDPDPHDEAREPDFRQSNRAPSLLERVKSIDFTSFYRSDSIGAIHGTEFPPEPESVSNSGPTGKPVKKSKSEKNVTQRKAPEKMKKSVSQNSRFCEDDEEDAELVERRRPATAGIERTTTIGDVDAKADDFINKFKQQLKLQRLDSIMAYTDLLKKK